MMDLIIGDRIRHRVLGWGTIVQIPEYCINIMLDNDTDIHEIYYDHNGIKRCIIESELAGPQFCDIYCKALEGLLSNNRFVIADSFYQAVCGFVELNVYKSLVRRYANNNNAAQQIEKLLIYDCLFTAEIIFQQYPQCVNEKWYIKNLNLRKKYVAEDQIEKLFLERKYLDAEKLFLENQQYVDEAWFHRLFCNVKNIEIKPKIRKMIANHNYQDAEEMFLENQQYIDRNWYEAALLEFKKKGIVLEIKKLVSERKYHDAEKVFLENQQFIDEAWFKREVDSEKSNEIKPQIRKMISSRNYRKAEKVFLENQQYIDEAWFEKVYVDAKRAHLSEHIVGLVYERNYQEAEKIFGENQQYIDREWFEKLLSIEKKANFIADTKADIDRLFSAGRHEDAELLFCKNQEHIDRKWYIQRKRHQLVDIEGWKEIICGDASSPYFIPPQYPIMEEINARRIQYIVHYTRTANLSNILQYGLLPRNTLDANGIKYVYNDSQRFDHEMSAICCSVSFPNYKMLYSKRQTSADWCIILINPLLLHTVKIKCCWFNAATSDGRYIMNGANSFHEMFLDRDSFPRRSETGIPDHYTTNPQAELLVLGGIDRKWIQKIVFLNNREIADYKPYAENIDLESDDNYGFFNPRVDYKFWQNEGEIKWAQDLSLCQF